MARNSHGHNVQTLAIVVAVEVRGDPQAWDWEQIIRRGANLEQKESVSILDVNVED
jgi:hypothetical protein